MKKIPIGEFEIISGEVVVSDPCYERDTWCQGILEDVREGMWTAYVVVADEGTWGNRVAELIVLCDDETPHSGWTHESGFEVGVDSGQAGVFDAKHYRDHSVVLGVERTSKEVICEDEPWYSFCCDRSLGDKQAGVIPFGAVSSSGYGDGTYRCYTAKDSEGYIVGIKIVFIDADEETEG